MHGISRLLTVVPIWPIFLLPLGGALFYLVRTDFAWAPIVQHSAPSFIFALWLCSIGLRLFRVPRFFALGAVAISYEVFQLLPIWRDSVRFDLLDVLATILGCFVSYCAWKLTSPPTRKLGTLSNRQAWLGIILLGWMATIGCDGNWSQTDVAEPITVSRSEFTDSVVVGGPEHNQSYSKLYEKRIAGTQYLVGLVEGKGLQIINNDDPLKPENTSFIHILGVQDLVIIEKLDNETKEVADYIVVANNYSDLVQLSLVYQKLVGRIENLYDYKDYIRLPPNTEWYDGSAIREDEVAVGYHLIKTNESTTEGEHDESKCRFVLNCLF